MGPSKNLILSTDFFNDKMSILKELVKTSKTHENPFILSDRDSCKEVRVVT